MAAIVIFDEAGTTAGREALRAIRQVTSTCEQMTGTVQAVTPAIDDLKEALVEYRGETIMLIPEGPRYTHYTRTSWRRSREIVEFIRVDQDGITTTTSQIWHRTAKEHPGPVQGPPKRLRFLTANRCDDNRGRHWNRKIR
ncbi:MAG TPA: hypothetical protein ENH94_04885 [Phycisphaerales bacterium]|nr:hypothetical protein [Phycisphaerales bacterium]